MKQIYILVALFFVSTISLNAQALDPALCYDGVDDYFNIPTFGNGVLGTNSDNSSFTIEFWVRDDNGAGKHYFSKHSNAVVRKGYFIERTATGTVIAGIGNNLNGWSTVTSTTAINDSNWHHIAFTYNSSNSEIKLYIDANLQATLTGGFTPVFDDTGNPRVGGSEYYATYFSGAFDEVRVWTSVRTAAEITANKNQAVTTAPTELILNYRFSDGITAGADNSWTQIILDSSNSGSHTNIFNFTRMGTCSNWASSVSNGDLVNNIPATHLNFDGVNDYVDMTNNVNLQLTEGTVEAWVKVPTITQSSFRGIVVKQFAYGLFVSDGELIGFDWRPGFGTIATGQNIADNMWHHLAMSFTNSGVISIYLDGVIVATNTNFGIANQVSAAVIGAGQADGAIQNLNADIDAVRIWGTVRNLEQINGSKNCELVGNESGLVTYYNLNQGNSGTDNSSITTLTNSVSGGVNGTPNNFSLSGPTSNFLSGSPVITGSIIPSLATVTSPVVYNQNDSASALMATPGTNGTALMWYTAATGVTGTTTAPIPSTAISGNVSYWVSSSNSNGCESERTEIVVKVIDTGLATHLNFDGSNDFVDCGNSSSIQITGNQITLEANVRAESFKPNVWEGSIINKEQIFPDNGYMLRIGDSGIVNFNLGNNGWNELNTPPNTLTINTWYHLAATYDGVTMKIYVDGVEVASSTSFTNSIGSSVSNLGIGNRALDEGRGFDGDIDEVRVWNVARTQSEIATSMDCVPNDSAGLAAYYKFNQGLAAGDNTAITTLNEATTNANNGTLLNFTLTGAASNWLVGSPVPVVFLPTVVSPVIYAENAIASALAATTGGTGLLWYTVETGGIGNATPPIPGTTTIGNTSYWVSSTNSNGCESERSGIQVIVSGLFNHVYDEVITGEAGSNFFFEFNDVSECQYSAILQVDIIGNTVNTAALNSRSKYDVVIDGSTVSVGNYYDQTLDLAPYIPFNNVRVNQYYGGLGGATQVVTYTVSVTVASPTVSMPASGPTVANVNYVVGDVATSLAATLSGTGTRLKWYTSETGSLPSVAPTPNTSAEGMTSYWVSQADANDCESVRSEIIVTIDPILSTSQFNNLNDSFSLYPNPTTGLITIKAKDLNGYTVSVYDINGRVLMFSKTNQSNQEIDLSNYASGVYLIKLNTNKGEVVKRIVKQ